MSLLPFPSLFPPYSSLFSCFSPPTRLHTLHAPLFPSAFLLSHSFCTQSQASLHPVHLPYAFLINSVSPSARSTFHAQNLTPFSFSLLAALSSSFTVFLYLPSLIWYWSLSCLNLRGYFFPFSVASPSYILFKHVHLFLVLPCFSIHPQPTHAGSCHHLTDPLLHDEGLQRVEGLMEGLRQHLLTGYSTLSLWGSRRGVMAWREEPGDITGVEVMDEQDEEG